MCIGPCKKILAFALSVLASFALDGVFKHFRSPAPKPAQQRFEPRIEHSRTWLIVHSLGKMRCQNPKNDYLYDLNNPPLNMRPVGVHVLLGGDGTVWRVDPAEDYQDTLTADAVAAAKQIQFTPATKDDVPVSMWLDVTYRCEGPPASHANLARSMTGEEWGVIDEAPAMPDPKRVSSD